MNVPERRGLYDCFKVWNMLFLVKLSCPSTFSDPSLSFLERASYSFIGDTKSIRAIDNMKSKKISLVLIGKKKTININIK